MLQTTLSLNLHPYFSPFSHLSTDILKDVSNVWSVHRMDMNMGHKINTA